jgi:cephalosporin hydroxylase
MKKLVAILSIFATQYNFARHIIIDAEQPQLIKVYAEDTESLNLVKNIMSACGLYCQETTTCSKGDNCLYILAGSDIKLDQQSLPDNYIVYYTKPFKTVHPELLQNALVIWDVSWENIARYKNAFSHYYYLPNENYTYLDPVILSCYLPLDLLSTYKKLLQYSNSVNTDISSHVPTLFCHAYFLKPSIMVEAGVRGHEGSNVALQAVTQPYNSYLIGIDINDDSRVYNNIPHATFLQMDDRKFPAHFKTMKVNKSTIDFIFIDTSHEYQHTVDEIRLFTPMLSEHGALGFHDSNIAPLYNRTAYARLNGTILRGNWEDAVRGVAPAIKQELNIDFDEAQYVNRTFTKDSYVWRFIHYPFCNGLTIVKRIQKI